MFRYLDGLRLDGSPATRADAFLTALGGAVQRDLGFVDPHVVAGREDGAADLARYFFAHFFSHLLVQFPRGFERRIIEKRVLIISPWG